MFNISEFKIYGKRGNAQLQITDDKKVIYFRRKYDIESGELTEWEVGGEATFTEIITNIINTINDITSIMELMFDFPTLMNFVFNNNTTSENISSIINQMKSFSSDLSNYLEDIPSENISGTTIDYDTIKSVLT